jgi:hypothetical protein
MIVLHVQHFTQLTTTAKCHTRKKNTHNTKHLQTYNILHNHIITGVFEVHKTYLQKHSQKSFF